MDIGLGCHDGYTEYLQQTRKTSSGLAVFLLKDIVTFHTFNPRAERQEDMEEHHEYK